MTRGDDEPTPLERELQGAPEGRGHVPNDDIPEPSTAPPDPASPSASAREPLPPPPGPAGQPGSAEGGER